MEKNVAYLEIYELQDKVLDIVSRCDTGFYLTGGTCLHRFISPKRYSDDLDFFTNDHSLFRDYVRDVVSGIHNSESAYKVEIDTRDFVRLSVDNKLKVDCVNDRVFRLGTSEKSKEGYPIDNVHNILANKISAVIGRDEPKDIFDIITIHDTIKVDWTFAIDSAQKKSPFEKDYLLFRIQSFPADLFDYLNALSPDIISDYKKKLPVIHDEIQTSGY